MPFVLKTPDDDARSDFLFFGELQDGRASVHAEFDEPSPVRAWD
jgi:hypothetical protein